MLGRRPVAVGSARPGNFAKVSFVHFHCASCGFLSTPKDSHVCCTPWSVFQDGSFGAISVKQPLHTKTMPAAAPPLCDCAGLCAQKATQRTAQTRRKAQRKARQIPLVREGGAAVLSLGRGLRNSAGHIAPLFPKGEEKRQELPASPCPTAKSKLLLTCPRLQCTLFLKKKAEAAESAIQ